jgi:hypothetical protein
MLVVEGYVQLDIRDYFVNTYCLKAVNRTSDDMYWAENSRKILDFIGL